MARFGPLIADHPSGTLNNVAAIIRCVQAIDLRSELFDEQTEYGMHLILDVAHAALRWEAENRLRREQRMAPKPGGGVVASSPVDLER